MVEGVLIAESLRVGAALTGVPLQVVRIWREEAPGATAEQPRQWTRLEFEAADGDAMPLAAALAGCLAHSGGWYVDFRSPLESFVVFAGRIFRYPRGDARGRAEAQVYARALGVPDVQLDWPH